MFPHHNIHKYTWTSPDWRSDGPYSDKQMKAFMCTCCPIIQGSRLILTTNLVVAKIRERLAGNKQEARKFHMERFNLKKLNEVEAKEKYRVEASNRFAAWKIWTLRLKLMLSGKQL
jgi:hypothetical protein